MNEVLKQAGVLGDQHVEDVAIISDHPTLMSRIVRLRLTYNGSRTVSPSSLIVKTGLPERQENEWTQGIREIAFNNDVAPHLPAGFVPRCFEAYPGGTAESDYVVLEDLTDTDVIATDWPLPPSEAQCRAMLTGLGRLNAAYGMTPGWASRSDNCLTMCPSID